MFYDLRQFHRIVVSGPHRSGTTICARMIAADTEHRFVPEDDFGFSDQARFDDQLAQGGVLQAPFMAHALHTLPPDVLVVFMIRGPVAVIRSQQRLIASGVGVGIEKYRHHQFHADGSDVAAIYETWEEQKQRIPQWREVFYKNLKDHPLWVPDPERANFSHRQTG